MNVQELEARRERAATEPLVITRIDDGFRVHTATSPARIFRVTLDQDRSRCTCPDFETHTDDPDWRCKHVLAVERFLDDEDARDAADERQSVQAEGRRGNGVGERGTAASRSSADAARMLLKRSVSPDGRIDSLSVEFSCPVDGESSRSIEAQAEKMLALQDGIVGQFRKRNRTPKPTAPQPPPRATASSVNGAEPGWMTDVGGMDGKWGRRLFINVKVNGRTLRFFGSRKQLGEAVAAAGYRERADDVEEGALLNLPCRVIAKPTEDGKYLNVERLLPADGSSQGSRDNHDDDIPF